MFKLKWLADQADRTYGPMARLFGIDISLLFLGWVNEWRLIDLRLPCNYGIYCQVGPLLLSIGRLVDAGIYEV